MLESGDNRILVAIAVSMRGSCLSLIRQTDPRLTFKINKLRKCMRFSPSRSDKSV